MIDIISIFYKVSMFSFFGYYAYVMNDTRIYAIEFSTKKDLTVRKWRNNLLVLILFFFWSIGWKLTPYKPQLLSTMVAELFFLFGYFIIYYIINIVAKETNKNHIERCEKTSLFLLTALSLFLYIVKPVESTLSYVTISLIVIQIILKIFVIRKLKYLKIKKGLYVLYISFFVLSISNNLMNFIYLYDEKLFGLYLNIRTVWEFVIGIWSIYGIITIKKARSVI